MARWANFFAETPLEGPRWANFFAETPLEGPRWANFFAETPLEGPRWGNLFAEMPLEGRCRASLLRRAPGSRALLLAPLTPQCAAKPYWWHGGQPAQATTSRVNMRMKGPRHPPIGLTCASKGPRAQDTFTETEEGLKGSQASQRSQYAQRDDRGGAPKDPASRCMRWPRRRRRKVTLPATHSVL